MLYISQKKNLFVWKSLWMSQNKTWCFLYDGWFFRRSRGIIGAFKIYSINENTQEFEKLAKDCDNFDECRAPRNRIEAQFALETIRKEIAALKAMILEKRQNHHRKGWPIDRKIKF